MRELTLMLLYLSRFTQREKFHEATDFYAWKGYDFDILNELDDADYIRQGNHPSRSKSVSYTHLDVYKRQEANKNRFFTNVNPINKIKHTGNSFRRILCFLTAFCRNRSSLTPLIFCSTIFIHLFPFLLKTAA